MTFIIIIIIMYFPRQDQVSGHVPGVQVPRDKMITLTLELNRVGWSFYLAVPVIVNNIGFFRAFHRILILQCLSVFFLQTSFLLQISIFADNWWESIKTLSLEHKTFNLKYWNKIFSPFKHSMGKGRRKSSLHVKDEKIQV